MKKPFLVLNDYGNLYIKMVLVEFDHPRAFICVDRFDVNYVMLECEFTDERMSWVSKKIPSGTIVKLLSGEISLLQAYQDEPSSFIYFRKDLINNVDTCESYDSVQDIEDLPPADSFIGNPEESLDWDFKDIVKYSTSRDGYNTTYEYVLNHGDNSRRSLLSTTLVELLNSIPSFITGLKPRVQAFVGNSYVIRLEYEHIELFPHEMKEFSMNFKETIKSFNEEAIKKIASKNKGFTKKLDKVMQILESENMSLDIVEYDSSEYRKDHYSLKPSDIKTVREVIKNSIQSGSEPHTFSGCFYMIDVKNRKFGFVSDDSITDSQTVYKGDIHESIDPHKIIFTSEYSVQIDELYEYQSGEVQGRLKSKFTLNALKEIKKISDK